MAFCSKCGTQLSDGVKFCPKCGQAVGEVTNATVSKPKARKPKTKKQVNSGVNKLSNTQTKGNNISSDTSLTTSKKIGLGITSVLVIFCLIMGLVDGMIVLMLACLCALVAIVMCYIGKIESKYSWWVVACSIFILFWIIGATAPERPKKFEAVEDGRAAYFIDSAHYENSDVQSISKIVMYEGNDRQDCKAEGVNSEGQLFAVDGKWEKREIGDYSIPYYYLDYKYFKLLIREDSIICYYKGDKDDASSIKQAWSSKIIGKIKDMPQEQENKLSENFSKKMKEQKISKVFFENGYKYSTSYRVRRNEGYGISCNYKYIIKIFNDGTKEISASNQTDDGSPATYGTHSCEIEKQSGSYRDVQAEWYEIKYKSGTSWGGKYHYGETTLYVDLEGNVIMLGENGNNKNIYEAVATKDCIFGKFQKEKLGKEIYRCKKCGKEYDPGKEALYSEEYCYNDYPQTCKTCGKTYTINTDGNSACLGTCSRCNERHRNAKIYRDVTGRDY